MLHTEKPLPRNRLANVGFALALVALVFAVYGSLVAPAHLRSLDAPIPPDAVRAVGYCVPFALGLVAVILGLIGLRRIEAVGGNLGGDMAGVFAVMVGGLAAVVGAVQLFADQVWPALKPMLA